MAHRIREHSVRFHGSVRSVWLLQRQQASSNRITRFIGSYGTAVPATCEAGRQLQWWPPHLRPVRGSRAFPDGGQRLTRPGAVLDGPAAPGAAPYSCTRAPGEPSAVAALAPRHEDRGVARWRTIGVSFRLGGTTADRAPHRRDRRRIITTLTVYVVL